MSEVTFRYRLFAFSSVSSIRLHWGNGGEVCLLLCLLCGQQGGSSREQRLEAAEAPHPPYGSRERRAPSSLGFISCNARLVASWNANFGRAPAFAARWGPPLSMAGAGGSVSTNRASLFFWCLFQPRVAGGFKLCLSFRHNERSR